jgi:hypothetical protein
MLAGGGGHDPLGLKAPVVTAIGFSPSEQL